MKEWSPLTLGLAAGAAAALTGAGTVAYYKLRRRKSPAEMERLRRLDLTRTGRIATGEVVGLVEPEEHPALLLVYRYDVAGVTYEVAQDVSDLPNMAAIAKRALGGISTVRYDMKRPGNSIVVSEQWSGLPDVKASEGNTQPSTDETMEK